MLWSLVQRHQSSLKANAIAYLLQQRVLWDAWGPLGLVGNFEHQVINELLSGGVTSHGRLAHLSPTRRAHLTIQRHLRKTNNDGFKWLYHCGINDPASRQYVDKKQKNRLLYLKMRWAYFASAAFRLYPINLLFCGDPGRSSAVLEDQTHHPGRRGKNDYWHYPHNLLHHTETDIVTWTKHPALMCCFKRGEEDTSD